MNTLQDTPFSNGEQPSTAVVTLTATHQQGQALQQYSYDPAVIDQAVMLGDMNQMTPAMRLEFYRAVCLSVGLNPLTQPFTPLKREDKTVWLYANSSCTQQLAALHKVSYRAITREHTMILGEPFYVVQVIATMPDGREVPSQSVVSLTKKKRKQAGKWPNGDPKWMDALDEDGEPIMVPLRGEGLANALMKADTKALRRATLALVGLGWMIADFTGRAVRMDTHTGNWQDDTRETSHVPLLDNPAEQAKGLEGHAADLFGDTPAQFTARASTAPAEAGSYHRAQFEAAILAQGGNVAGNLEGWYAWAEKRFSVPRVAFTVAQWARLLQAVRDTQKRLYEARIEPDEPVDVDDTLQASQVEESEELTEG